MLVPVVAWRSHGSTKSYVPASASILVVFQCTFFFLFGSKKRELFLILESFLFEVLGPLVGYF